ncbi:hypothetical protein F5Y14DRAFT_449921 [Nemania sp. NC0429]|nr:hypothetical protein F5Y14DRAFT_449921 [Nemania sp. NC0429]
MAHSPRKHRSRYDDPYTFDDPYIKSPPSAHNLPAYTPQPCEAERSNDESSTALSPSPSAHSVASYIATPLISSPQRQTSGPFPR